MQTRRREAFTTVHTEGAILPPDLLRRVADGDKNLGGLTPEAYHLLPGERLNEAINRSWNRLLGAWAAFRAAADGLRADDPATGLTRDKWLYPLFQELGYGRLPTARAIELGGRSYPVSHAWQDVPIHLVGRGVDLDRRAVGVAGAARTSPHGLVQELLNRSDAHLWGIVSNGARLRILRDNVSITRQSYVEWDLEAMLDGEVYADFVLLWLVCHQSRVEPLDAALVPPTQEERGDGAALAAAAPSPKRGGVDCWLERWTRVAQEQGTRALDHLRDGVQAAIVALGRGFLAHPANGALRDALQAGGANGGLETQDYYRQLLRLVYRLLFLFVAEDRELLLDPRAEPDARDRYTDYYSTARLRRLAERRLGTRHADLYHALRLVMDKLGSDVGCPELGLPAFGSYFFSSEALANLAGCEIANHDLLDAVRALAFTDDGRARRLVDYKNLGAEELGSVYESLLELHPELNVGAGAFALTTASGNERKTTGSYYTPTSLIQCLLDSALDPVLEEAARKPDPERALLDLKVCDPACGSGHFLIAAAHRIAKRLASVRTGDEEPSPEATRTALRDVIGRCIYGVDLNPMAVELCKVSLWMEAVEPGKPLSFLDHHIRCGNSLLGTTPALLADGIPDAAFTPIEGDDKAVAAEFRKRNKRERAGQQSLFAHDLQPWDRLGNLATAMLDLDEVDDDTIAGVRRKQQRYESLVNSSDYRYGRFLADAWCAAFVWKKVRTPELPYPLTEEQLRKIERSPHDVPHWMRLEIERLAAQYGFFHWYLAFPDVFTPANGGAKSPLSVGEGRERGVTRLRFAGEGSSPDGGSSKADVVSPDQAAAGWHGGFDVVVGNPPWERIKLSEKEWFATRRPDIANAPNAAQRRRLIEALRTEDPPLHAAFLDARRQAEGESQVVRGTGRYPLTGRGDVNTYAIFAETNRLILGPTGRVGCIVPSGIATDDTTKFFFQDLMESRSLASLYDFENREGIFPGVHRSYKFCLLTLAGSARPAPRGAEFAFFLGRTDDLRDDERRFVLSAEDIALLNPNTRTCPVFRTRRDANLSRSIYRRVPVLVEERTGLNPWRIQYLRMIDQTNDSHLFQRTPDASRAPLYEGKMVGMYDHRAAGVVLVANNAVRQNQALYTTLAQHMDPAYLPGPLSWVSKLLVDERLGDWLCDWLLGVKDISSSTNERTSIFSVLPRVGVGNSVALLLPKEVDPSVVTCLLASLNSFVVDYTARPKVGGLHLNFFILKQFPVLPPSAYAGAVVSFIAPRALELTYTAWDLEPFARDVGYDGPPFRWDEERRFLLRCELDALFFRLYGIERADVDYIMETFPIVKRRDVQRHGEYRTKRVILEIYDAMADATRIGEPYQTRLDPPPADPRVAHPNRDGTPYTGPGLVPRATASPTEGASFDPMPEDRAVAVQPTDGDGWAAEAPIGNGGVGRAGPAAQSAGSIGIPHARSGRGQPDATGPRPEGGEALRPVDVVGEAGSRSPADGGDGAPKGIRTPAATADIDGWARLPSQPSLSHLEATPAPPPPRLETARAPLQPTLPQFADDQRALRERVLNRCLDVLRSTGPLAARDLAKRLAPLDGRIDKRLINSVLAREGAAEVRYDAARHIYSIRSRPPPSGGR